MIAGRLTLAMINGFLMYSILIAGSIGDLASIYDSSVPLSGGLSRQSQHSIGGAIDRTHAALAELRGDAVMRNDLRVIWAASSAAIHRKSSAGR